MYTVSSSTETNLTYNVLLLNGYEYCDCPAGIGGKFCKHICAIHSNGFLVENIPILTTKNRIELGNLAVGNSFDPTFLEPMEDNIEIEVSINTLNNTCPRLNSSEDMTLIDENCRSIDFENQCDFNELPNKVAMEINSLQNNFDRIKDLAQNNGNNTIILKNLKLFNKMLGGINTVSDLTDVFFNKLRRGKLIGTQPTSRSRRTRKITSGAKRIQAGRPSNVENCMKIKKKQRLRCIGKNINNNVPHAKTH